MASIGTPALWAGFIIVVAIVLVVDLYVGGKASEPITKKASMAWTAVWFSLAAAFGLGLWVFLPPETAADRTLEFFSAYLVEYSLSVDNLFVFLLLFRSYKVPRAYEHRVLFWGIFGAVVLRALFIFAGTALLSRFHFLIYVFGGFLVFTAVQLLLPGKKADEDVSEHLVVKLAKRFIHVTDDYDGSRFFTLVNGVRRATPLLVVLVSVELSDLVFAIDSIPAVFGISLDPFIVYTSNIFAVLGLRSLYFMIAGTLSGLRFLSPALGIVLGFVGIKMCLPLVHSVARHLGGEDFVAFLPEHISTGVSLTVVAVTLGLGMALSLLFPGKSEAPWPKG